MGTAVSSFFESNCSHFLSVGIADETKLILIELLAHLHEITPETVSWPKIESFLNKCPKNENILSVIGSDGYNILQWAVGLRCVEMVRWILNYGVEVNRGPCSLPLHIATFLGYLEIVELLVKYGAKVDLETRICFPGLHLNNCELRSPIINCHRSIHSGTFVASSSSSPSSAAAVTTTGSGSALSSLTSFSDKSQSALYYAIDSDKPEVLAFLIHSIEENWLPWQPKRPLLYIAFERKAWNCIKSLISDRQDEINQCYDEEYYPIHKAVLNDIKFFEILLKGSVKFCVRTATQQLTILHVLLLLGKKSANDTAAMLKLIFEHGGRELINQSDSLGNTPLHALIVRYALEEGRYATIGDQEHCAPWTTWDMLHLLRYMLQQGCSPSINQRSNSALACVLRHVRDWEFRFELLNMLLQHGGDPNCVGRDGSVPLIVCLVPLLNKGLLHLLNHTKKVSYLNCVRLLCKYGANPNCSWRANLTPLHVLVFTANEYVTLMNSAEKGDKEAAFMFIRQVLTMLLQHKLDPNVIFSPRQNHILLALLDMVINARHEEDLDYVYNLTLTLIQYRADPNVLITNNEATFCHSQSSLFLKKSSYHVLYYYIECLLQREEVLVTGEATPDKSYAKLIFLYYHSMKHKDIYSCLKKITKLDKLNSVPHLQSLIHSLLKTPRSLKSLSRNSIYYSLTQNLGSNINKLQLPGPLREYVLDFMP